MSRHRGAAAEKHLLRAQRLRQAAADPDTPKERYPYKEIEAGCLESMATDVLKPACEIIRAGGEAVDTCVSRGAADPMRNLLDTLRHPNGIGLDASEARLRLIDDARVVDIALDASESAKASNSLEKMLTHQMAAAHHAAMKLIGHALGERLQPGDVARLMNTVARLMDAYQGGFLTLLKVRSGGKQTVVVQHVQVSDGGKAVIAGSVAAKDQGPSGGSGDRN